MDLCAGITVLVLKWIGIGEGGVGWWYGRREEERAERRWRYGDGRKGRKRGGGTYLGEEDCIFRTGGGGKREGGEERNEEGGEGGLLRFEAHCECNRLLTVEVSCMTVNVLKIGRWLTGHQGVVKRMEKREGDGE